MYIYIPLFIQHVFIELNMFMNQPMDWLKNESIEQRWRQCFLSRWKSCKINVAVLGVIHQVVQWSFGKVPDIVIPWPVFLQTLGIKKSRLALVKLLVVSTLTVENDHIHATGFPGSRYGGIGWTILNATSHKLENEKQGRKTKNQKVNMQATTVFLRFAFAKKINISIHKKKSPTKHFVEKVCFIRFFWQPQLGNQGLI